MEEVVGWNSSSQITLSYFCNTNFPFVLFSAAANFRPSPTSSSATTTSGSLTATTRSTRTCRPSWTPSTRTCRRWTASWTTCRRAARSTWWESGVSRGLILELPSVKSVHKLCSSSEALQRLLTPSLSTRSRVSLRSVAVCNSLLSRPISCHLSKLSCQ